MLVLITSENNFCFSITSLILTCAARRLHPRKTWSVDDTGSSQSIFFCNVGHIFGMFWVFLAIFVSSIFTGKNNSKLRWKYKHSHPGTFFPSFFNVHSHETPAKGWQWRLPSSGTNGSLIESQCCRLLAFGILVRIFGQSSTERWRSSGASFILTCVYALTASLACPEQPGNLEVMSRILAAVTCDA